MALPFLWNWWARTVVSAIVSALLMFGALPGLAQEAGSFAVAAASETVSAASETVEVGPGSIINNLIVTAPLAGVMLYLYFDERKERRAAQAQLIDLIKVILPALEKSTGALDRVVGTQERISQELSGQVIRSARYIDRGDHGADAA